MSEDPAAEEQKRLVLAGAGCLYPLLLLAALVWLWLRGRLGRLEQVAIGEHGPWFALGAGAVVGLGAVVLGAGLSRYLGAFARLEAKLTAMIGPLDDRQIWVLALMSALGEEIFFRLALLDATNIWVSAALFALLHAGRGLWMWAAGAFAFGLLFGAMVERGLGLLSVTVAHALLNYLSLRRMVLQ